MMWKFSKIFVFAFSVLFATGSPSKVFAQDGCATVLPKFATAMREGTAEALSAYLEEHAPCFEAPVRAKLKTLEGSPEPASSPKPESVALTEPESAAKKPTPGECAVVLPKFAAAMKVGTTEALSAYLGQHAPCFEVPVNAKLQTLKDAPKVADAKKSEPDQKTDVVEAEPKDDAPKVDITGDAVNAGGKNDALKAEFKDDTPKVEITGDAVSADAKKQAVKAETKVEAGNTEDQIETVEADAKNDTQKTEVKDDAAKDDGLDLDFLDSLVTKEDKDDAAKVEPKENADILEELDDLINTEPNDNSAKPEPKAKVVDVKPKEEPVAVSSCVKFANIRSKRALDALFFQIVNRTGKKLIVNWIDYEGERKDPTNLVPAGTFGGQSFVGYAFEITNPDKSCVEIIVPTANQFEYIIK